MRTPEQRDADLELEIDREYELMVAAKTDDESQRHYTEMMRLVYQRSIAQRVRMELERRKYSGPRLDYTREIG